MAQYKCPGCGQPFNGRKCRNCFYETFTEEITHGDHIHQGEPLVIRSQTRRPIPRKDPFDCDTRTRKQPKKKNWVLILVLLYFFAAPVLELAGEITDEIGSLFSFTTSEVSHPEPLNQPVPEIPEQAHEGTILYEEADVRIVTPWQGENLTTELPIWLFNDSHRDLSLMLRDVVVNGFVMENTWFSCDAPAGSSAMGTLQLEEVDLGLAGISEIGEISLSFYIYDTHSYDTLAQTQRVTLVADPDVATAGDFGGLVFYEAEDLKATYLGYQSSGVTELLFLMENRGAEELDVMLTDLALDGKPMDAFYWCHLPPETRAVRSVTLLYGDCTPFEGDTPTPELSPGQQVTFALQITNDHETVDTDPITLTP